MKICKIPQNTAMLMLQTLNQIQITPGVDNADMYVGLGAVLKEIIAGAEEEVEDGNTDGEGGV